MHQHYSYEYKRYCVEMYRQGMKKRCEQIKTKLSPRKDKKIIEGLNELIKEIDKQTEGHS